MDPASAAVFLASFVFLSVSESILTGSHPTHSIHPIHTPYIAYHRRILRVIYLLPSLANVDLHVALIVASAEYSTYPELIVVAE